MSEHESEDKIKAELELKYKKAIFSIFKKKHVLNVEKPDTLLTKNKNVEKFD